MLLTVVVPVVHVVACIFLIVVVLLQTGKGADMGAVFGGGGSQTLFGSTGAGNLLTKLTTVMAATFMATSLTLAVSSGGRQQSGLLDRLPDAAQTIPAPSTAPNAPAPGDVAGTAAPTAPTPEAAQNAAPANAATADATPTAPATHAPAAGDATPPANDAVPTP
jgi:preprotein translocase subunit SecG